MHGLPNLKIKINASIPIEARVIFVCFLITDYYLRVFFLAVALRPNAGHGLLIHEVF